MREVRAHSTQSGLKVTMNQFVDPVLAPDASFERRPGNPKENTPTRVGNAHWAKPQVQLKESGIMMDPGRDAMTATFGTQLKPKGLSGALRRVAYTLPDYRARRWMLLLLADRVEGIEYSTSRGVRRPGNWLLAAGLLGGWLLMKGLSRPRRGILSRLF
jgi:hypothetical protein